MGTFDDRDDEENESGRTSKREFVAPVISLTERRQARGLPLTVLDETPPAVPNTCSSCRDWWPPYKQDPGRCYGGIEKHNVTAPLPLPKPWPTTAAGYSCKWYKRDKSRR